ncbi:hypothetical protein [Ovoidimarina sediminis]|uniref:hypothetical protein n=1 Tax=Ovoidimarina sediminis TaxID=3079856 RepID=UPI002908CABB|nr:hypothetical protein [Rhodophyticola sp. MJ-SS7]MDU8946019.1 hypothetical protein [Rhodophyticola sp. MJ-SS7]
MVRRGFLACALCLALVACGARPEVDPSPDPIGDFRLGFNIVVANDITKSPGSRDATEEELTGALRAAMEERLGPYDGDGLYHIGLRIEAYSLGRAGVPIVYAPRSVFLIAMNVWDDATQEKLTEEAIRITAFDSAAGPLVGGGIVRSREDQIEGLAYNAAREVEKILTQNADTWFAPKAGRTRTPFERDPATGVARVTPEDEAGDTSATETAPALN